MAKAVDGGPIRPGSREITNEPSDDELVPAVSKEDSAAQSSFPILGSDGAGNRVGQRGDYSGNPSTSQRAGSPVDAPSPQRPKVSSQGEQDQAGRAPAAKRRAEDPVSGVMVTITKNHIALAGRPPHPPTWARRL